MVGGVGVRGAALIGTVSVPCMQCCAAVCCGDADMVFGSWYDRYSHSCVIAVNCTGGRMGVWLD